MELVVVDLAPHAAARTFEKPPVMPELDLVALYFFRHLNPQFLA